MNVFAIFVIVQAIICYPLTTGCGRFVEPVMILNTHAAMPVGAEVKKNEANVYA